VLAALCVEGGHPLPFDTRSVATARGGEHLCFRAPADVGLRNTAATLGPMIDTRAAGGYVVGPGSTTPDGVYRLTDDRAPADLPAWLVQALTPKPRTAISAPVVVRSERLPAYINAALRGERDRVAAAHQAPTTRPCSSPPWHWAVTSERTTSPRLQPKPSPMPCMPADLDLSPE
jgi:nucleoid-associated protein YgaU